MKNSPPNGLDIEAIAPHLASTFSPNLYRYMRKQRAFARYITLFRSIEDNSLWLGYIWDGDFIGARLMRVLCAGRGAEPACWMSLAPKLQPVPDFWEQYLRLGRCAIDPEHRISFIDDRWTQSGDLRTCRWCGHQQQRRVRIETVQREVWRPVQDLACT